MRMVGTHQIGCPTLITAAEGDLIAAGARTLYDALQSPKTWMEFSLVEVSGGHCESLARALYHQRVFDWLDETLRSGCARPVVETVTE